MMHAPTKSVALLLVLLPSLGCGDSDSGSDKGTDGGGGEVSDGGGEVNLGSATLTIGEETWQFDSFGCAFGHAATESDIFSFNTTSLGVHSSGNRVQMQAEIQDDTGQGRYEGADVIYTIYINDIEDFQNPTVDFESTSDENTILADMGLAAKSGETIVSIDGDNITGSGLFDDLLTEGDFSQTAGTLTGMCGEQSRR